jgi:hypothetical protein
MRSPGARQPHNPHSRPPTLGKSDLYDVLIHPQDRRARGIRSELGKFAPIGPDLRPETGDVCHGRVFEDASAAKLVKRTVVASSTRVDAASRTVLVRYSESTGMSASNGS